MKVSLLCISLVYLGLCSADYACVCNYKDSVTVYSDTSAYGFPLGNMTNWECKQVLNVQVAHQWIPVAFEHQIGYVERDPQVLLQMCNGHPTTDDMLTNAAKVSSTTIAKPATSSTTAKAIMVTATSSQYQTSRKPSTATPSPTHTTTPTTSSPFPTVPSTDAPVYQTTVQHYAPSTVIYNSHPDVITANTDIKLEIAILKAAGHLELCPPSLVSGQQTYHDVVGQFGHKCYALGIDQSMPWQHAEETCVHFGGHLVHIENQQEQAFVTRFVQRHSLNKPVWLGLHDRLIEGTFTWTSGGSTWYYNFAPGHWSWLLHDIDDCVILDPRNNGLWNDVTCGLYHATLEHDVGEMHNIMCQIYISSPSTIIG